jgi:H+-transporting ATPase
MIYQRMVTWTFNKIIKTFQIVVFVVLAFLLTGHNVVGTFEIILLLFFIDFVTLSISTDNVRWSKSPDTWNIKGLFKVAAVLGTVIVVESLVLLYIGIYYLGLSYQSSNLHTFVFDILLFSGMFTILIVRERDHFWKSVPSRALSLSIVMDIFFSSISSVLGMPGLPTIPFTNVVIALIYCFIFSLLVNDFVKVKLIRLIPA